MPMKPKRPCSYPGCPNLTDRRYCEQHERQESKRYEKYDRDQAAHRRYGRAWKRIRDRYIAAHPLCEQCQKEGRITPAQEVHHIIPLSRGGTHSVDNLKVQELVERIEADAGLYDDVMSLQDKEVTNNE